MPEANYLNTFFYFLARRNILIHVDLPNDQKNAPLTIWLTDEEAQDAPAAVRERALSRQALLEGKNALGFQPALTRFSGAFGHP